MFCLSETYLNGLQVVEVIEDLEPIKLEWNVFQQEADVSPCCERPRPSTPPLLRTASIVAVPRGEAPAWTQPQPEPAPPDLEQLVDMIVEAARPRLDLENPTWCRVLGIKLEGLTMQTLQKKRRHLALRLHPDKVPAEATNQDLVQKAFLLVEQSFQHGRHFLASHRVDYSS